MHNARLNVRNEAPIEQGDYVLYWMQQSQRIENNFALAYAIKEANRLAIPLRVVMSIDKSFKDANMRHFIFLVEGFKSLAGSFKQMGVDFRVERGPFTTTIPPHMDRAALFVMDKPYLRELRETRRDMSRIAAEANLFTVEVESELIVPVEHASNKLEHAARTIRPKIHKQLEEFLEEALIGPLRVQSPNYPKILEAPIEEILDGVYEDGMPGKSYYFYGGEREGKKLLEQFIEEKLPYYLESNDPSKRLISRLSPYLHFGHLSPLTIYKYVEESRAMGQTPTKAAEAFIEQLIIRRDLAFNFVYYEPGYDAFDSMSVPWAYETMKVHEDDIRERHYTIEDYENLATHDPYFNAAMREMQKSGHMHNYMRMYWGKRIIVWSPTYREAYETMLHLNNKYFLDGRDPNSYAGVAWCFGRHDQGFKEREVFGKLRPLTPGGLKRKFKIDKYVTYTKRL